MSHSEEEWRSFVGRSFNNGGRDFMVAERDGEIVAMLMSTRYSSGHEELRNFRIIVHPDHRRRGIAKNLLALVEAQDPERDAVLRAELLGKWRVGTAMLERAGYVAAERLLWMKFHGALPETLPAPEGIVLRPYAGGARDDAAWRKINDAGYAGSSDYSELTAADLETMRAEPRFALLLAERAGEIVGLCHTKDFAGKQYVNSLVVSADCRGAGLGRALLVAGMHTMRGYEPGALRLNVRAENEHAVALYRSIGWEVDDEILEWRKVRTP